MQISSSVQLTSTTTAKIGLPDSPGALIEIGNVLQSRSSSESERIDAMQRFTTILASDGYFEYSDEDRTALVQVMEKSEFLVEARRVADGFRAQVGTAAETAGISPAGILAMFNRLSPRDQLLVQAEGGLGDQTVAEWKATMRVQAQIYEIEGRAERGQVDPRLSQIQALAKQLTNGRAKETNAWTHMMEAFFAKTGWASPVEDIVSLSEMAISSMNQRNS